MSRIMIAGTGSGCGKTTVTCAVLGALKARKQRIISFKSGPDYIDPMFHQKITGVHARNLDIFLMGETNVKYAVKRQEAIMDIAVIEGVMGLYDGIGSESSGSANHLSVLTDTPVLLVVQAKGKAQSVCAEIAGYVNYEKNNVKGVILNGIRPEMYSFYQEMIEEKLHIDVYGCLADIEQARIESRHLGLVTADEIKDIEQKMQLLAQAALAHIDMDRLIALAQSAKPIRCRDFTAAKVSLKQKPVIYAARDEAFCFFYEDNHEFLQALGAELRFFSPLHDERAPEAADGIVLWGGYPELHAFALQNNHGMKTGLLKKIQEGLPVYAECGGFIYLQQTLTDLHGSTYMMLGALSGHVKMADKLQNFGYVTLEAQEDNLLCQKGEQLSAHSFHHSKSSNEGEQFIAVKKSTGRAYPCIIASNNIFAGYPHLHFWGNPKLAENFVRACGQYADQKGASAAKKPGKKSADKEEQL